MTLVYNMRKLLGGATIALSSSMLPVVSNADISASNQSPFGLKMIGGCGSTRYGCQVGQGLGIQTPVGNVGVQTPFGGFNLQGQQSQTAQPVNNQQPSGVYCAFGKQTLLASSIDSCEGAGGQVNPAQMTYNVKCSLSEGIVMASSNAACARINGKVTQ